MPEIVYRGPPGDFSARLNGAFRDPKDLLDLIGQRVKEASVKAFRESKLGEHTWPPQYPGTPPESFANVAAALADLNQGRNPKLRHFTRKPPLRQTGRLLQSIAYERSGPEAVRVGTTVQYASAHQFGKNTSQPVKPGAKRKLKKWLKTKSGREHGSRLAHLLNTDVLWTQVSERPFLGITPEVERKIQKDVYDWFKRRLEATRGNA